MESSQTDQTQEIPQMVNELFDLSKAYLRDNTVEPMRRLGRLTGFSLLGGLLMTVGWLFMSIAGLRLLLALLPDSQLWSTLAYVLAALAALLAAALLMWGASQSKPKL